MKGNSALAVRFRASVQGKQLNLRELESKKRAETAGMFLALLAGLCGSQTVCQIKELESFWSLIEFDGYSLLCSTHFLGATVLLLVAAIVQVRFISFSSCGTCFWIENSFILFIHEDVCMPCVCPSCVDPFVTNIVRFEFGVVYVIYWFCSLFFHLDLSLKNSIIRYVHWTGCSTVDTYTPLQFPLISSAYQLADHPTVSALYHVTWTLFSVVGGSIKFKEYQGLSKSDALLFLVGFTITLLATYLAARRSIQAVWVTIRSIFKRMGGPHANMLRVYMCSFMYVCLYILIHACVFGVRCASASWRLFFFLISFIYSIFSISVLGPDNQSASALAVAPFWHRFTSPIHKLTSNRYTPLLEMVPRGDARSLGAESE